MRASERAELLDQAPGCCVSVVGDVMIDVYAWGRVDRISPEAPVPVVQVTGETSSPGGAANAAVCVAALGSKVELFGTVGIDARADELTALLAQSAVTSRFFASEIEPTITKQRIWSGGQQLLRLDTEVLPATGSAQARLESVFVADGFDAVLISDYGKGVIDAASTAWIIEQAGQAGIPVVVDPKHDDFSMYAGCTLIKPNEKEARRAFRTRHLRDGSLEEIGSFLTTEIAQQAVITRGANGIELFADGQHVHLPVHSQNVYDVTGAGDVVAAVLTVGAASKWSLVDACRLANVAARISVSRVGTGGVSAAELLADLDDSE
jgi:D-beta-D-heptose 7-phosphate kinase/D-beta-D-heptose 1-phosphate adenosyltransferase